ncbi:uncharacterized protein Pyn_31967 [Prunus yedoensis var. nudiflora]|uniref:Uncharacterized protein n=1 Tax=Prunus yedoensis var. nudiflora TaxID=2094558 RepID=A0A314XXT1_PRUYE|nr:uncharacterized protein Pyn_31967 [Prunus yedoensis var. nudiflora]
MEALWNLEDKWRLSTQEAFVLLVSAAFAVIGLCMATTVLLKKAQRKQQQIVMSSSQQETAATGPKWSGSEPSCGWGSIKGHWPILMGEKCELPRFSGLILYDEEVGLFVTPTKKPETR